jgi:hypothetical protein
MEQTKDFNSLPNAHKLVQETTQNLTNRLLLTKEVAERSADIQAHLRRGPEICMSGLSLRTPGQISPLLRPLFRLD